MVIIQKSIISIFVHAISIRMENINSLLFMLHKLVYLSLSILYIIKYIQIKEKSIVFILDRMNKYE